MIRRRFKHFMPERVELSANGDEQLLSVSEYYGVKPRAEAFDSEAAEGRASSLEGYRIVRTGDFVMNYMLAWKGAYGVSTYDGIVSPAYAVYEIDDRSVDRRYIHHRLRSDVMRSEFRARSKGIIESRLRLYPDAFLAMEMDLPDIKEQKAIADFLDRETARIDQLIDKKQLLVELLSKKEKATVKLHTLGQYGQRNRKPSKAIWLPELPADWPAQRCAQIFLNLDHKRIPLNAEQRADLENIYPYYGASGVIDYVDQYLFDGDNILVGEDGANLVMQSTPIAFKASGKYWVNNHAHIIHPRFGILEYWVHALNQVPYEIFVTGSAQPKLTSEALGNIVLPCPPIGEQRQIVNIIEEKCRTLVALLHPVKSSIDRLREFRSALITAAVTGQMDVTMWRKRGNTDIRLDQIEAEFGRSNPEAAQ